MRFKTIVTGLTLLAVLLCNALELKVQKDKTGNFILENQFIRAAVSAKGGKIVIFEDKIRQTNHALSNPAVLPFLSRYVIRSAADTVKVKRKVAIKQIKVKNFISAVSFL